MSGNWLPHGFRRFFGDRQGSFATMTAIMAPVALTLAAFAVDIGSLHLQKREAQSLVDLAAISAAANIGKAQEAALLTMTDNGIRGLTIVQAGSDGSVKFSESSLSGQMSVIPGVYSRNIQLPPSQRFRATTQSPNAVKVVYTLKGNRYFAGALMPPPDIVASAVASTSSYAAFSIGSRLASLDGGIANALLSALLGSKVSLSVMDYNALLNTDINLLSFLKVLATDINLTAGTYDTLLKTDIAIGQLSRSLANTEGLSGTAKAALGRLANAASGSREKVRLENSLDLGDMALLPISAEIKELSAKLNIMEFLTTSLMTGGKNQIKLDLGVALPGVADVTVDLAIGEPPQHSKPFAVGKGGEIVRTAQTRLWILVEVGGLLGGLVRLPIYVELAFAEAQLDSITCPTGRPESIRVNISGRPGVVDLYVADIDRNRLKDFGRPVPKDPGRILNVLGLVTVTSKAHAEIANISPTKIQFTRADIDAGVVKSVHTKNLTGALVPSLLGNLKLDVNILGLNLLLGDVAKLVGNLITPLTPAIDNLVVGLLSLLGVKLGEADIRVHEASCSRSTLVM
ncbi:pilus assembly protein TadG-related protein [Aquamicrobium sp. LC103]|uniref:pilus assembly protein TadG-related protein n=1 Tax=Aquamicrobium sp. LC103 TaxID=1120658 RepID=UPI00063ED186|nr:pilus assembly protein TadG-related protein [Aquamicrobium sp. LC103]TKT81188.1 hypothetical protein XW59_004780 [Aquamicrobium sp. LC103]